MLIHREEKRDIPVVEDVDVVVCGGVRLVLPLRLRVRGKVLGRG